MKDMNMKMTNILKLLTFRIPLIGRTLLETAQTNVLVILCFFVIVGLLLGNLK